MTKFVEKQASSIDEALRLAMDEIQRQCSGTAYEIINQETIEIGKKGFFGFGAVPAKVRVTYQEVHTPSQDAKKFVDGLLEKMGIHGEATVVEENEAQILLDIRGEDMGAVIGRRGDTLDAIQYLTSLSVNRGREDHIRITLDTEGYRSKREESLQRLARKMAGKVLKYRKNMTLEPMNPYERRIIHAALQDYNGVTTYSTGTEPNRRVVVALERGNGRPHRAPRRRYEKKSAED